LKGARPNKLTNIRDRQLVSVDMYIMAYNNMHKKIQYIIGYFTIE